MCDLSRCDNAQVPSHALSCRVLSFLALLMANSLRDLLGLSQQRLASWLHIDRTALAHAEANRRGLPLGKEMQDTRLSLAAHGKVFDPATNVVSAVPPLPAPTPPRQPLETRLRYCQHHVGRLRYELEELQKKAAPYEARLVAVPALRAYAGPVPASAREANWIDLFELEATHALKYACGAGPQRLLAAHLAGLEREVEELAAALAEEPPAA